MKNLIELVIGGEMRFYHLKMLKKLPDFGLMYIELVDFLSRNLRKLAALKM